MELVGAFELRPLRTKEDYERALAVLDPLVTRDEGTLSDDERDYMETLTLLVEAYDAKEAQDGLTFDASPIDVLKHLMEAREMTTTQLGRLLGSKGIASEVLNGKRELSKAHVAKLAEHFGVGVAAFFPAPTKR